MLPTTSRLDGGTVTAVYCDSDGLGVGTAAPVLAMKFVAGPMVDQVLAAYTSESALAGNTFYLADHQGSTRLTVSTIGTSLTAAVESVWDYDSFGNVSSAKTSGGVDLTMAQRDAVRFSYTGREYDSATDLYYYRARWYDAATARFISSDPAGLSAGDGNLYRYVGNNPLNFTDPTGMVSVVKGNQVSVSEGNSLTYDSNASIWRGELSVLGKDTSSWSAWGYSVINPVSEEAIGTRVLEQVTQSVNPGRRGLEQALPPGSFFAPAFTNRPCRGQ